MGLNAEKVLEWVERRFDDVVVKGNEIKVNSIFCEDRKRHLWINPEGGKKKRPFGAYRCWKTDRRGSVVGLVSHIEKCTFEEALELLDVPDLSLAHLEKKVNELFDCKTKEDVNPTDNSTLQFPESTYFIEDDSITHPTKILAEVYLLNRKLPAKNLAVCVDGDYKDRIIIPYYDKSGKLVYYNGRHIGNNKLRYLGPDKSCGIGKEDVLFAPSWPPEGSEVYLTEGEFDAISIYWSGKVTQEPMYSMACGGKYISERQIEYLRPYRVVLCLDTDKAGKSALKEMYIRFKSKGINCQYVRPPTQYKDWNKMLIDVNEKIVVYYIMKHKKPLDPRALTILG